MPANEIQKPEEYTPPENMMSLGPEWDYGRLRRWWLRLRGKL